MPHPPAAPTAPVSPPRRPAPSPDSVPDPSLRLARVAFALWSVSLLLPEGGVSLLDAPGQPFWDPEADRALFQAIESTVVILFGLYQFDVHNQVSIDKT